MSKKFLPFILILTCGFNSFQKNNDDSSAQLRRMYEGVCQNPFDVHEHIPILRQLAYECSSVVEIGVRSIVSTWGLIMGLSENSCSPKSYIGIDLEFPPAESLKLVKSLSENQGIDFSFWRVNDLHIQIEPTDLLFIDSLHTYCHLTYELETFSPNVRKYICIHDTSHPWENQDDNEYHGDYSEYPAFYDRQKRGLWPAVVDFLDKHPEWILLERRMNNHGFTILKRIDEHVVKQEVYPLELEDILKNKIILCTGPSLGSYDILKKTTESDLGLIPFKKIFVSTNDPAIIGISFNGRSPVCEQIPLWGKQLDCLNCIISTIKNAVNDPEVLDDDIILFKHETVFLSDMGLVKKAISKLIEGYDMVARSWEVPKSATRGTDAFFVKAGAIREIIKDYPLVSEFVHDGKFCEHYFTTYVVNKIPNVYDVSYCHSNGWFSEIGFYHFPSCAESQRSPWDKSNYHELFNH